MHQSTRTPRYQGRATLRTITTVPRCYDCGRATVTTAGNVGVRRTDAGVVGFAGLATCGRVWLCPVCNSKVMARRAVEIGAALTWAAVQGLHVVWGSLTVRHTAFHSLSTLLDIQRDAWRFVVNSKWWRSRSATATRDHVCLQTCESSCERKRGVVDTGTDGRVGYIRAAEITENFEPAGNGWHPHFHPIILVRGHEAAAAEDAEIIVSLWLSGVHAAGGEAGRGGAQQLRVVSGVEMYDNLSSYVTKASYEPAKLALETVWSQGKNGVGRQAGTVSHWSLLAEVELGLADQSFRWIELEEATNGHRMITWSRGLRQFAGLSDEKTDEDVAGEEVGTKDDTVCVITGDGWQGVRDRPAVLAGILDVLEAGGMSQLAPFLDQHGVEWVTVADLADLSHPVHAGYAEKVARDLVYEKVSTGVDARARVNES